MASTAVSGAEESDRAMAERLQTEELEGILYEFRREEMLQAAVPAATDLPRSAPPTLPPPSSSPEEDAGAGLTERFLNGLNYVIEGTVDRVSSFVPSLQGSEADRWHCSVCRSSNATARRACTTCAVRRLVRRSDNGLSDSLSDLRRLSAMFGAQMEEASPQYAQLQEQRAVQERQRRETVISRMDTFEVSEDAAESPTRTCPICMEDFGVGEKIRVLPCKHQFHSACIDQWLLMGKFGNCPICKDESTRGTRAKGKV